MAKYQYTKKPAQECVNSKLVSVPLRGKYRGEEQEADQALDMDLDLTSFPSPCGVNIVAKSILQIKASSLLGKFPSPCGVNIVAKKDGTIITHNVGGKVSVPLRGKYRGEAALTA